MTDQLKNTSGETRVAIEGMNGETVWLPISQVAEYKRNAAQKKATDSRSSEQRVSDILSKLKG